MKFQGLRLLPLFIIVTLLFAFSLIFPIQLLARSGCCSYHGGVCGCGCCDGSSLSSTCAPYYPGCGGSYVYQPPPTCPLFSSYNSITDKCECYSGYIASGSQCISQNQACQNLLGFSSRYNSLSGKCECSYGYVIGSAGTCISGNSSCWNKYGYSSTYDSLSNTCKCNFGYRFNFSRTMCISNDQSCQEQFGYNSKATISGDKCECKYGYVWEGNICIWDTSSSTVYTTISTPIPTKKPTAVPTVTPRKSNLPTSSPNVKGIFTTSSSTPTAIPSPISESSTSKSNVLGYLVLAGVGVFLIRIFIKKNKSSDPQV